jgi:hypothetical protein
MSSRRPPDNPFQPRGTTPQGPQKGARFDRLNALFSGGGAAAAPPAPRARGVSFDGMGGKMRKEQLRMARSVEDITSAADALLAHHELPDEPELLCKMVHHPDGAVGERVLAELGAMHARGKLTLTGTMREALQSFAPRCREPNAQSALKLLLG